MKIYEISNPPAVGIVTTLLADTETLLFKVTKEVAPGEFIGLAFFHSEQERAARLSLSGGKEVVDDGSIGSLELLP